MMATPYELSGQKFPNRLLDIWEVLNIHDELRMLEGHYRNARAGVKPNYSCFAQRSIKVINKIYPFEFVLNIMKIDPLLLKLTV